MADDLRRSPALVLCFAQERRQSVGVVDVAVGVDRGVHPLGRVTPYCAEGPLLGAGMEAAGVDEHRAVPRAQRGDVDEGLVEAHALGHLVEPVGAREGVVLGLLGGDLTAPELVGELEEGGHGVSWAARRQSRSAVWPVRLRTPGARRG